MKFRMCPYFIPMHICGIAVSIITIVFGGWFWRVGLPDSNNLGLGILFTLLGILFLIETIKLMRKISFPWISFSENGVMKEWLFNVCTFIPWEECAELGILLAKLGGGKNHGAMYWVYFSKVRLTNAQLNARKRPNLAQNDLIMVEYYPNVLSEVLKYVPKDQIRNLHLLEK